MILAASAVPSCSVKVKGAAAPLRAYLRQLLGGSVHYDSGSHPLLLVIGSAWRRRPAPSAANFRKPSLGSAAPPGVALRATFASSAFPWLR